MSHTKVCSLIWTIMVINLIGCVRGENFDRVSAMLIGDVGMKCGFEPHGHDRNPPELASKNSNQCLYSFVFIDRNARIWKSSPNKDWAVCNKRNLRIGTESEQK